MGNLEKYAESELELAGLFDKDSDYDGDVGKNIMQLIKVFAKQGHSGMSASMVVSLFQKLASFEPINSITGEDKEWVGDGELYQNKRLASVFKVGKEGKAYYLDAIVFKDQDGYTFTSSGSVTMEDGTKIESAQYIKFPFLPKTFYVDVISTEWGDKDETTKKEGGGWWSHKIKTESQLDKVFEYYEKK